MQLAVDARGVVQQGLKERMVRLGLHSLYLHNFTLSRLKPIQHHNHDLNAKACKGEHVIESLGMRYVGLKVHFGEAG